jgi:hypothetical protein
VGLTVRLGVVLAGMLLAGSPCSFALNPALNVSQYAHTAWKIRDGFSKGLIISIAQTPDGYLWLRHGIWSASFRWRSEGPLDAASRRASPQQRYLEAAGRPRWDSVDWHS